MAASAPTLQVPWLRPGPTPSSPARPCSGAARRTPTRPTSPQSATPPRLHAARRSEGPLGSADVRLLRVLQRAVPKFATLIRTPPGFPDSRKSPLVILACFAGAHHDDDPGLDWRGVVALFLCVCCVWSISRTDEGLGTLGPHRPSRLVSDLPHADRARKAPAEAPVPHSAAPAS